VTHFCVDAITELRYSQRMAERKQVYQNNKRTVTIRAISSDLWAQIRLMALEERLTVSELVEQALAVALSGRR
jgi:hypothetical protein